MGEYQIETVTLHQSNQGIHLAAKYMSTKKFASVHKWKDVHSRKPTNRHTDITSVYVYINNIYRVSQKKVGLAVLMISGTYQENSFD